MTLRRRQACDLEEEETCDLDEVCDLEEETCDLEEEGGM